MTFIGSNSLKIAKCSSWRSSPKIEWLIIFIHKKKKILAYHTDLYFIDSMVYSVSGLISYWLVRSMIPPGLHWLQVTSSQKHVAGLAKLVNMKKMAMTQVPIYWSYLPYYYIYKAYPPQNNNFRSTCYELTTVLGRFCWRGVFWEHFRYDLYCFRTVLVSCGGLL